MSNKTPVPHPLPQTGGSFEVKGGTLVPQLETPAKDQSMAPALVPDLTINSASKEA